jgi:hypothetical protein
MSPPVYANGSTQSKAPKFTSVRPLPLREELAAPRDSTTNSSSFFTAIAFSNDSSQMAAFSSPDGRLMLFNVTIKDADVDGDGASLKLGQVFEHKDLVSRDNEFGACHSVDEQLSLSVKKIVFSRDAQFMAVADSAVGVYVYDIDRHRINFGCTGDCPGVRVS